MKLDKGLFRDPATMTFPSRLPDGPYLSDPEHYLPPKVADVPKDVTRNYPHTKRVGNYLLGKTLGEGSFAKVKESLHVLTGEKVAIKVIDKKKAKEDAYVRKNMRREGKLLQMVRHRHVLQLFEIMETENSYYLVTELCSGGDLMDHICAKKKLEEKETKKYIRSIISAVHYLHSAGILHRDLKVENLLLDENKEIKIIDFGLSNAVRVSQSKDGHVTQEFCVTQCGSPAYAAPELLGNKKYGPEVDIWSIGVNMYAMLTGNLPFTVEPFNIKNLHNKMLNGEMNPIPDTLSKNGRDFLKQLLNPNPEKRLTLLQAMRHPWICDARNKPLDPAPFPNKLNADDLDNNILKHMSQNLDYRLSETIRLVTSNIPSNATSTYHMFHRKLKRYNAEMRVQGKISATEAQLVSSSRSTQNTSGYASRDDVIDLIPLSSPAKEQKAKPNITDHQELEQEPKPTTSGSNPTRVLNRQGQNSRQVTFHGHETKPHSAPRVKADNNQPPNTAPSFRPYTTREQATSQEQGQDVQFFTLSTEHEPSRKANSTKLWVTPHSRRTSTKETKMTPRPDQSSDRPKFVLTQRDLPAIAEKPLVHEEDRSKQTSKSVKSPLSVRRARDVKPVSNYSFRPRGAFTDAYGQGPAPNKVTSTETSDQPTRPDTSTEISTTPVTLTGRIVEPRRIVDHSDRSSDVTRRRERRETSLILNGNKFLPRNVLIDVAHYERFSRRNGSRQSDATNPASVMTSLDTPSVQSSELQSRRPLNMTYPNKIYRPGGRNLPLYSRNRFSVHGNSLNVTGEKTGVSGTRVLTLTRDLSHDHGRENTVQTGISEGTNKVTTALKNQPQKEDISAKPATGTDSNEDTRISADQDIVLPDI